MLLENKKFCLIVEFYRTHKLKNLFSRSRKVDKIQHVRIVAEIKHRDVCVVNLRT